MCFENIVCCTDSWSVMTRCAIFGQIMYNVIVVFCGLDFYELAVQIKDLFVDVS